MEKLDISKNERRKARILALQVLYSFEQNSDTSFKDLFDGVFSIPEIGVENPKTRAYARRLAQKTLKGQVKTDVLLAAHTKNWKLERLSSIDRNLLRLAVTEISSDFGTPLRVVINEVVEIAKQYGTDDSAKFVNGVIDAVKNELDYTE